MVLSWKWENNILKDQDGTEILRCDGPSPHEDVTRRLIAAAPILLEACKAVLLLAGDEGDLPDNGEYSGAAIADQVYSAVQIVTGKA